MDTHKGTNLATMALYKLLLEHLTGIENLLIRSVLASINQTSYATNESRSDLELISLDTVFSLSFHQLLRIPHVE